MIAATGVTKSFPVGDRTVEILHGIDLAVPAGQLCAVMGPSGSGKSTLLTCLAGLEAPTTGSVSLLGRDLATASRADLARMRRRELGFVFQSYNLVPTLSARENIALPMRLAGDRPAEDRIEQALESMGIAALRDQLPPSMSGGEQQRVAIARVLAQDVRVLFADEPTGALDTGSGERALAELARIAHHPGRCAVVVTHDPRVAATCDRVVFLLDGRLARELTAPDVEQVASTLAELIAHGERGAEG